MKLTILGSGNWELMPDRHPACLLVEHADQKLLFDAGYGAYHLLTEAGVDPRDLTGIFITHFQPDHMSDAMPIVHARLLLESRSEVSHVPLKILGPPGLVKRWKLLHEISDSKNLHDSAIDIVEVEENEYMYGDLTVRPFLVRHLPNVVCLGFRVEVGGRSLVYCGDVGGPADEQLLSFKKATSGCDVLVIEGGAGNAPSEYHLTIDEAVAWGKKNVKNHVILNHVPSAALEASSEFEDSKARPFVSIARDGMEVVI